MDCTSDFDLRLMRIIPSWKKGTTLSGGFRPKKDSYGERHPLLAFVAERLKQPDAHIAEESQRRCPSGSMLGMEARSMCGMEKIGRAHV